MALQLTRHARARWAERFPDLDPEEEWSKARRLGQKLRKRLRQKCPAHAVFTTRVFRGRYFMVSRRVIFVMAPPEVVITVLPVA